MLIIILDSDELCSNDSFSSPSSNESYSFDKIIEKKNQPKEKRIICCIKKNFNFINNLLIYIAFHIISERLSACLGISKRFIKRS